MNVPAEILPLQEILWNQVQDSLRHDEMLSAIHSILGDLARGIWPPVAVAAFLLLLAALLYHPRIRRGGFWIPAFGLFGGAPKLYLHTRPSSFCGLFMKSRHRVTLRRRAKG